MVNTAVGESKEVIDEKPASPPVAPQERFNAFELASRLMMGTLNPLISGNTGDVIRRETRFMANGKPQEVLDKIVAVLKEEKADPRAKPNELEVGHFFSFFSIFFLNFFSLSPSDQMLHPNQQGSPHLLRHHQPHCCCDTLHGRIPTWQRRRSQVQRVLQRNSREAQRHCHQEIISSTSAQMKIKKKQHQQQKKNDLTANFLRKQSAIRAFFFLKNKLKQQKKS